MPLNGYNSWSEYLMNNNELSNITIMEELYVDLDIGYNMIVLADPIQVFKNNLIILINNNWTSMWIEWNKKCDLNEWIF